jgi:hypothetical protein
MRTIQPGIRWRRLAWLTVGTTFILSGCNPELRATVEDGIISMSTSLLSSLLQAFIQLAQEANDQTARVLTDFGPVFA